MRNILLLKLETKVAISILLIVLAVFLFTLTRSVNNFNKFIEHSGKAYEEVRIK